MVSIFQKEEALNKTFANNPGMNPLINKTKLWIFAVSILIVLRFQ